MVRRGIAFCAAAALWPLLAAPAAAEITVQDLVEIIDLSSLRVSPDGQQLAFRQQRASLARNSEDLSWWAVDLRGRPRLRRLGDGGQAQWTYAGTLTDTPPTWSPDGRWVYYRRLVDSQLQVHRAAAEGGQEQTVAADDADILDFRLSADGRTLTYQVGATRQAVLDAERQQKDDGVLIDASVDAAQNLFAASQINGRLAALRLSGKWFRRSGLLSDAPMRWHRVDLDPSSGPRGTVAEIPAAPAPPTEGAPWSSPFGRPSSRMAGSSSSGRTAIAC